jgi:hypothetical protein
MREEYVKFVARQFGTVLSYIGNKYDMICFGFLPDDSNFRYFLDVFMVEFGAHFKVTIITA